jgi:predicted metal-dependent phosphoesterase TrpH
MDPLVMLRRARSLGLDGLVITEHDWLWTEPELDELRKQAPDLVILSGIEVSAREGHFLSYGVTNPFAVPRGIPVADLCREVHRQGGVVVGAHPFRFGQRFDDILQRDKPDLDGLEMMSSNMDPECRRRAHEVQSRLGVAQLGNSDAHHEETLGYCFTHFAADIAGMNDLVDAIRQRRTTPHERTQLASIE